MTYKIAGHIWRKPGTTPAAFKAHYENHHIPLIQSLVGTDFPLSHTRSYLTRTPSDASSSDLSNANYAPTVFAGTADDFDFDVYAELVFEDEARMKAFRGHLQDPEAAAKLAEDEERFIDRTKFTIVKVDESCVTTREGK